MKTYPEIDVEKDCLKDSQRPSPWDGVVRQVYKVPLRLLHYNVDNGRIATFVSGYRSDTSLTPLEELPLDRFNDVIGAFVKQSSSTDIYNHTYRDIAKKGQLQVGAILADGTVVAGNRRFTVLRQLIAEGQDREKFGYFLCNIYPMPKNEEELKQIKRLETLTQFNEDSPVPYGPIDKLVDIYHNVNECSSTGQYSALEYAKFLNMKPGMMRDFISRAQILVDYLNYIGKPGNFDIARKDALDGPISELAGVRKKAGSTTWSEIKGTFYHRLWSLENQGGDRTRLIRKFIRSYESDPIGFRAIQAQNDEEELSNDAKKLNLGGQTEPAPAVSPESDSSFNVMVETYQARSANASAKREPIGHLNDAYNALNNVYEESYELMAPADKEQFKKLLDEIEIRLATIKKAIANK
jgi:hypothetical protein